MLASPPVDTLPATTVVALGLGSLALALSMTARPSTRQLVADYGVFALFGSFALLGVWLFVNRDASFVRVLLERYWLAALLAVFVLEGAMLLYFAPSESLVPVAVGMARTTDVAAAGPVVYALVLGTAVIGATVGQYLLFVLAKRWGRERLLSRPWFRLGEERLATFEQWFRKWGVVAVPVSNALPFTRGMLTVPAGLSEMGDRRFVALSALGTLVFETVLALGTLGVLSVL